MDTPAKRVSSPEWFRATIPAGIPGTVSTLSPALLGQLVGPWRDCDPQTASVLRIGTQKNIGGIPPGAFFGPLNGYIQTGGALVTPTPSPGRVNGTVQLLASLAPGGQAPLAWRWFTLGADSELSGVVFGRNISIFFVRWDGFPAEFELYASLSPLSQGSAGGSPFEWRAEFPVSVGPGPANARDIVPPPASTHVEISGNQTTLDVDIFDRDGVTQIGGFQWTATSSRRYFIPQRTGFLRATSTNAQAVTFQFSQGHA
jgi:hypothetical protein